jgi:hypothetical protein
MKTQIAGVIAFWAILSAGAATADLAQADDCDSLGGLGVQPDPGHFLEGGKP